MLDQVTVKDERFLLFELLYHCEQVMLANQTAISKTKTCKGKSSIAVWACVQEVNKHLQIAHEVNIEEGTVFVLQELKDFLADQGSVAVDQSLLE